MKKRLLVPLILALTLLSGATVLLTVYAIGNQESAIDAIMRSYVLDLSDSVASSLSDSGDMGRGRMPMHGHPRMMYLRMLTMIPTLQKEGAGGVLLLASDGRILAASPGGEVLRTLWRRDLTYDDPVQVRDPGGNEYYMVAKRAGPGLTVMTAVSRTYLLGPVTELWHFRVFFSLATSMALFVGILALWRRLVLPLRKLVQEVRSLKWGRDRTRISARKGLFEIEALSEAIEELSAQAAEREELKARYVSDMVQIQEESRKQLARELHDGPLQGVAAAIKHIQLALESPDSLEKMKSAEEVAQSAARDIRNYCDELSPSWVSLGLSAAMAENADRLSRSFDVEISLAGIEEIEDLPGISEEHVLALVRILQEAVSNSVRHGGAKRIGVDLREEDGSLRLSIKDDGRGFSPIPEEETDYERLRTTGHRGLANIYERIQLLQGTVTVASSPSEGCRIKIILPFGAL